MFVYAVYCRSDNDGLNFGVYSTKEIAYEHINKIVEKFGYDKPKWEGDGFSLEKDGIYQGYIYIVKYEVDKDMLSENKQ